MSALARDLYYGEMNQKDRESRRLSRLHDRLADSPVLFLQGETGTGKSYFSAKMAKASGQAAVISLGPSDSEQTLMKRWRWKENADGDPSMAQQNRALMEWASIEPDEDDKFVTLVLDEANLAKTGLLASLNGLWEPEPCIYVDGQPVPVGTKQQAEARQESMPEVFYLNACDCSWDKPCEKIQAAKINGGIVVISEMNLIDSQHLEGELNDILAGDAHPGFHLFATTNPPEYSGRKPLSPALK
ncbi:ATP-binding protein [Endozoicomonas sp. 8E]|uniref:ATP-binding protein n=1 Tax=Endozoicomonas sp. 8E TaxID=3035692 RepID=UPI002938E605|nr:AAA family ATPase [Endozoicomonas sp. 8E]WOG28829.1 AAA family ATPase [Endozoicomonas sp. 8E]